MFICFIVLLFNYSTAHLFYCSSAALILHCSIVGLFNTRVCVYFAGPLSRTLTSGGQFLGVDDLGSVLLT